MVSTLDIKRDGGVACVTLNRPDKRNAIDDATRDALAATFAGLDEDAAIRVVIFTGAGTAHSAPASISLRPAMSRRSLPRSRRRSCPARVCRRRSRISPSR